MSPDGFESFVTERRCPCGAEDWECDAGFRFDARLGRCEAVKTFDASQLVPPDCAERYLRSDGYRKKATSHCAGGVEHPRVAAKCPGTWGFLSTLLFYVLRVRAAHQMLYLGAGMLLLFIGGKYVYEKRSKDSFLPVPQSDPAQPAARPRATDSRAPRHRLQDAAAELGETHGL